MSGASAWDAALPALAGLVAVAAVAKLARPGDTARALARAGLPLGEVGVRFGAAAELAVAGAVLAGAGRWAVGLLALSYLGFAGFVGLALVRRWPLATCGCFGEPDTPPTLLHALVCLAAAWACAGSVMAGHASGLAALMTAQSGARDVVFGVLSLAAGYASYLLMSAVPRLGAERAALRGGKP